jgi:hypothetical protein
LPCNGARDLIEYPRHGFLHLHIGETQNAVTAPFDELLPIVIVFCFECVNATIHFNYEVMFRAIKVHNEWSDGDLPSEFQVTEFSPTELFP